MKKTIAIFLCAIMVFSLNACGGNISNIVILEWKSEVYKGYVDDIPFIEYVRY